MLSVMITFASEVKSLYFQVKKRMIFLLAKILIVEGFLKSKKLVVSNDHRRSTESS